MKKGETKMKTLMYCKWALIGLVIFFVVAVTSVCLMGCVGNQIGWNKKTISAEASISATVQARMITELETKISNNMETFITNYMKTLISASDIGQGNTAGDMGVGVKTGDNTATIDAEANMKKKEVNK